MPKEFYDMVCSDIQRIEGSDQLSSGEKLKLHRELDGRYQACIKDWYKGLWGSDKAATIIYYSRPCLKIGGMPDWGGFYCQARRFDAGILTDFKSNQRSPGGKRCPKTAFCHFSNTA